MTDKTPEQLAADEAAAAEKAAADAAAEKSAADKAAADAAKPAAKSGRRSSSDEKIAPKQYTGPKVGSIAERDYFAAMNADGSIDTSTVSDKPVEGYGVQLGVKGALVTPELARVLGDDTPSKPLGV